MRSQDGLPDGSLSPGLALLQQRWMLQVLDALLQGELYFNDLARLLPRASPTTLQVRLKTLSQQGLVEREVKRTLPPSTLYRLTPRGQTVRVLLDSMKRWCMEHHEAPQGDTAEVPVLEVLGVLGQKWALPIMGVLSQQERGFVQLMEGLGGINSSTLKKRLEQLRLAGLVEREVLPGAPVRTCYRVTPAGWAFRGVMWTLHQWELELEA